MIQTPDYTILDHLTAMCAVVDFNSRYLYVNQAAAKHAKMSKERMLGHSIQELSSTGEADLMISHLKECLNTRQTIEFEDPLSKWKIKIEPVTEGAFIHWIRMPASKTKVKIRGANQPGSLMMDNGYLQRSRVLEIEGWLDSLDLRTRETNQHITHVADITVALAKMAGIPENELVYIRYGALLHDIGKIGIPDAILLKADTLTTAEWKIMRQHPLYAYDLFEPVEFLRNFLSIPYSHHEWWDGTGYPQGIEGEQIPLPARLFAIADVWDSLSFDRVYRKAWQSKKVIEYIHAQSGTQFDPALVDLFFRADKDSVFDIR